MATQIMGSSGELNPRLTAGARGPVARLLAGALEYLRYRRTVTELEMLSDRELQDIGLNRGDIEHTARLCARRAA